MKYLKITAAVLALSTCMSLASCSDDDDNPSLTGGDKANPAQVFTGGMPKKVGDMNITCAADGKVTSISDGAETATFRYLKPSEDGEYDVIMTVASARAGEDDYTFKFKLNAQGFVEYALETYSEGDTDEWWFKYNSDGQLNYMKRSEGGNEVTDITYSNGNITSVNVKDEDNESSSYTITYGNQANKGSLMFFDLCFGVDMDEMDVAYYAGLLGKATKNLPAKLDEGEGYYSNFSWQLNAAGLPQSLTCSEYYSGSSEPYTETYTFNW